MCGRRTRDASVVMALCAIWLMKAAADPTPTTTTTTPTTQTPTIPTQTPIPTIPTPTPDDDDDDDVELLKQVLTKKCLRRYTATCLKLDAARLIDRLDTARAYQLMPGVSLVRARGEERNGTAGVPAEVIRSLARGADDPAAADRLDGYLADKADAYLSSLSVDVRLADTAFLETGRGKKNGMQMALWSAGTLAAIAIASLAAMSGKALVTAMLALALAAACALKGHQQQGGGQYTGKTSHYEIITKPAVYEHDHLVHGAAAYSTAPYSYARHLTADDDDDDDGGGGGGHPNPPLLRADDAEHQTYPLSPVAHVPAGHV